ncbi:MAG TPA: SapC family protein [Caulobacteraceae bacterium]|jgi:hypothetical protein|nr:SapC family protein [Caulobacteraceae bacterium]
MTTIQSPAPTPVTGGALFYVKPEPLNSQQHAGLGLRRVDRPFEFAAKAQAVPVTVGEMVPASLNYPIIFAGETYQPLAVLGLQQETNMFLQANGHFEAGVYVPAYIRRYPFVLASDDARETMVVCVDVDAPMVGDLPDVPFFDAAGQATEYTKSCIQFCNDYEIETRRTQSLVTLLRDLDLFESRKAQHTPLNPDGTLGEPQDLAEFWAVSDEKLKALPDAKIRELLDNGALRQIYAHINSLTGWDKLIAIALTRINLAQPPAQTN